MGRSKEPSNSYPQHLSAACYSYLPDVVYILRDLNILYLTFFWRWHMVNFCTNYQVYLVIWSLLYQCHWLNNAWDIRLCTVKAVVIFKSPKAFTGFVFESHRSFQTFTEWEGGSLLFGYIPTKILCTVPPPFRSILYDQRPNSWTKARQKP
jgi:hypothetical protein